MSSLEGNERGRAKNGAIQYASNQFNAMADENTLTGVKVAVGIKRAIDEAYIKNAEKKNERLSGNSNKPHVVTGGEVREAVENGTYREILER